MEVGKVKDSVAVEVSHSADPSESQFKTMKYRPGLPARFGCIQDARGFCRSFFDWYNREHRHSGIALMTLEAVHHGRAAAICARRQWVLEEAYLANPGRFVRGSPKSPSLTTAAWINGPATSQAH
jgi:hypothetical protein